jgi:hypothetical protein
MTRLLSYHADGIQERPKHSLKVAASGNNITSHFCPDCGTTAFHPGESFPQAVIINADVLDGKEWPQQNVPKTELYVGDMLKWAPAVEGAAQVPGMPS